MTRTPLVSIVGASGAVGREVSRLLALERGLRLRLGGRRIAPLHDLVTELSRGDLEITTIDVDAPGALAEFCHGSRVVVNCAGPSLRILDLVARAAFDAGADYVDPGGDHPLYERLSSAPPPDGRTALLTAGMMPGLSALLPRWLAQRGFDRIRQLTVYVGGRGRLTPGTAGDYLLSLEAGAGEPQAAWRGGVRISHALETLSDVELPFFPEPVIAQPFLSGETDRVARALGLRDVSWYNVFDGRHMLAALRRIRQAGGPPPDLSTAVADLSHAAELDLFGKETYQTFVISIDGDAGDRAVRRTMVVRGTDAHALTGTVSALAAVAIVNGDVTPGVFYAGEVLPPAVVERLGDMPAITGIDEFDETDASLTTIEEGVL